MPVTIKFNVVKGSSFRTSGGFTEVHHVYGLDESRPPTLRQQDAAYARDATTGKRMPKRGDPHDRIPNAVVDDVSVDPFLNARVKAVVRVSFKAPDNKTPAAQLESGATLIRMNNTLVAVTTSVDALGRPMAVFYDSSSFEKGGDWNLDTKKFTTLGNYVKANAHEPSSILEFVRLEDKNPMAVNDKFQGLWNKDRFQGSPRRTWLCLGVSLSYTYTSPVPPNAPKQKFETHYQFAKEKAHPIAGATIPENGETLQIFIDQRTGMTPTDVDPAKDIGGNRGLRSGQGWAVFMLALEETFSPMKLPDLSKL